MDATETTWTANPTALGAEYVNSIGVRTVIVGNKYTLNLSIAHHHDPDATRARLIGTDIRFDGSLADFRRVVGEYRARGL